MHLRPTSRSLLALLIVLVLVAPACGGDEGEGGAAAGPAEAPGDEPQTLRIAVPRSMAYALDPAASPQAAIASPLANVFDPVVIREGEEFVPHLATEWENVDDLTWEFTLRDDVTFHDGSTLDAQDVVASLERVRDPEGGFGISSVFTLVESVEATDERTVTIRTSEPMGTMLPSLSMLNVAPSEQIEGLGQQEEVGSAEVPVGSGPYRLESHTSESELVLVANEDYWDGPPAIDRLEFVYIPEISARMTALETGEVDITWNVGPDQLAQLEGNDELQIERPLSYKYYLVWFNAQREPFTDVRVRQAMNYAVDVDQILTDLFPDYGQRAQAPIPEGVFGWSPQEPYPYDPERARELLAEAGYADGFNVAMQWAQGQSVQIEALADTLISYWAEVGVTVEPTPKENAQWGADLISLNYDINLQDNPTVTGDADYSLGRLYGNDAPQADAPYSGYDNPELIELLTAARTTIDQDERADLYADAIALMWEEAVGLFPLDLPVVYVFRTGLEGVDLDPAERVRFEKTTLAE